MTLNLCVLTPNRMIWNSEVKEIILSTNSGQIGVLPNHAPHCHGDKYRSFENTAKRSIANGVSYGRFPRISNNEITILGNNVEINTLEIVEANLSRAEGKRQAIESNLALRRARAQVETVKVISY